MEEPKLKTKSLNDLRVILSQEIDNVREGKTSAANVNAITNAAGKIISTVKLEIDYARLLGRNPNIGFIALEEVTPSSKEK